jgi:hypothetical protein
MKTYGGIGCIDAYFLDLRTNLRWVVCFTPRPLYPRERALGTHWRRGWVGPRAGLDDMEKTKFLTLPGLELRTFGRPTRSQSLYRLCHVVRHTLSYSNIFQSVQFPQRKDPYSPYFNAGKKIPSSNSILNAAMAVTVHELPPNVLIWNHQITVLHGLVLFYKPYN